MRLTEGASLLTVEVPRLQLEGGRYYAGRLARAVTKSKRARTFYASSVVMGEVEGYVESSRARAVRRAQAVGRYDGLPMRLVTHETGRRRRLLHWRDRNGVVGHTALAEATVDERWTPTTPHAWTAVGRRVRTSRAPATMPPSSFSRPRAWRSRPPPKRFPTHSPTGSPAAPCSCARSPTATSTTAFTDRSQPHEPGPDERDLIRAAMDRILSGHPERSNGALTIVALAEEADVPRNALTQRHPDLKNEFYDKVRARGQTPDSEKRLRQQVRRLKKLRAADAEEIARLKADVEALVGALHQSNVENRLLRQQLADDAGVVRMLLTQPRTGPGL